MKADLTRNTFHPAKHFTHVLMQQGRVQLDADWNEQAAIVTRYLRSLAADLIGPCGGPSNNLGYRILPLNADPANPVASDFAISGGHFYVRGILCENEHESAAFVPPQGASGTSLTITPDRWILDRAPFQNGDFLEIYDATGEGTSVLAVVTSVKSAPSLTLTASTAILNKWFGKGAPRIRRVLIYSRQPDYPLPKTDLNPTQGQNLDALVYLDVWERLITCVEDDSIREVALGGPDTAARSKLVCQVKWTTPPPEGMGADEELSTVVSYLENKFQPRNRGLLKARVLPSTASADPCIISPTSNYRGPENQLYRVEIHTGSTNPDGTTATPTFTWSRENGSPVFPILSGGGTPLVTLETLGRDDRFGLAAGDWVEVEDDDYVLLNRAGTLLQVQGIDRSSMQVTLKGTPDLNVGNNLAKHPLLRRWDQKQGDETNGGLQPGPDGAALIKPGVWLDLEDGVQVLFFEPDPNSPVASYRTGDYWLIPARVAAANVEWPTVVLKDAQGNSTTDQIPLPPLGVTHYYAPLAEVAVSANGVVTVETATPPSFDPAVKSTWP